MESPQLTVAIAVPLSAELVQRIRAAHPAVTVLYEPELLPPTRFAGDHAGDPAFRRSPEQERRYWDLLGRADILYGFPNESAEGLARIAGSSKLRWVQAMSSGAGGPLRKAQLSAAELQRITVTTSAGIHAVPLAEFVLLGVLNGLKDTPALAAAQAQKFWPEHRSPVRTARGTHMVIAGLGEIGLETARLAGALGMRVSGTKRSPEPLPGLDTVTDMAGLPALLGTADVLVCTLPGTAETANTLNAEVFNALKPGAIFINVGRGTVVDEAALLSALDDGQLAYACLDVFATEPLPHSSPLWAHPRVLVSPHSAALSSRESDFITNRFVENLQLFRAGEPLLHVVDPLRFY